MRAYPNTVLTWEKTITEEVLSQQAIRLPNRLWKRKSQPLQPDRPTLSLSKVLLKLLPAARLMKADAKTGEEMRELYDIMHEVFRVCGDLSSCV